MLENFNEFKEVFNARAVECSLTRVSVVNVGGEDVAIVWDKLEYEARIEARSQIIRNLSDISQVIFPYDLNNPNLSYDLESYFSGNAARALGYMLLEGKSGQVTLNLPYLMGANVIVSVEDEQATMSITPKFRRVYDTALNERLVMMNGIGFLVSDSYDPTYRTVKNIEGRYESKRAIYNSIMKNNDMSRYLSAGLILAEDTAGVGALFSISYIYNQNDRCLTSFDSDMAALSLALVYRGHCQDCVVKQKNGSSIKVNISSDTMSVSGSVSVVYDGSMFFQGIEFGRKNRWGNLNREIFPAP